MALKPHRQIVGQTDDISYFCNDITNGGSKGGVVVTTGAAASGHALDNATNQVHYAAAPSGRNVAGVLGTDVVDIDLNRQPLNPFKSEAVLGDKVTLYKQGWFLTNMVDATDGAPAKGDKAYVGPSGRFTKTNLDNTNGANDTNLLVGKFMDGADEDGYYKVAVNIV